MEGYVNFYGEIESVQSQKNLIFFKEKWYSGNLLRREGADGREP